MSHPCPAEPIRVIHVAGDDRQMGQDHGSQVGEVLLRGMPRFYFEFWSRMLRTQPKGFVDRQAFRVGRWLIEGQLVPRLLAAVPEASKARIAGMAEAVGAPFDEMKIALVLPDLMPLLQAFLTKLRPSLFIEVARPPRFGCSSFVARGDSFLYGRNLDFPGVGYWDRYPVIQVSAPKGGLRSVGFVSAGVPFGGITGVNEAQISVALHQHYCRTTSLRGTLPFFISERILSQATSLAEAREILDRSQVATAWAFVVTDGKTKDGFVYETHAGARGVNALKGGRNFLAHANYFQTGECQSTEYATTSRMNWDNHWRKRRLDELGAKYGAELTPQQAVKMVADHFDPYWGEEKYINRTVSQVYNIQGLVLDPVSMQAWMAEGDAPIHLGHFRRFDLGELLAGRDGRTEERLEGFRFRDTRKETAKRSYILSFIRAFDGDFVGARQQLKGALEADFCAEAALVGAILAMKAGDTAEAVELLLRAREWVEHRVRERGLTPHPPEYFEVTLFLARAYDLRGDRTQAIHYYRELAGHPELEDDNLRALARAEGPYGPSKLDRIIMPYSTYIPFE